jgi:hypothetical protein
LVDVYLLIAQTAYHRNGLARFSSQDKKYYFMELQRSNSGEKRKRKAISRPVLVYSVKPGQTNAGIYSRENNAGSDRIWKS